MSRFFKLLPHTADKKLLIYGKDLEELFRNGALAICYTLKEKFPKAAPTRKRHISLEAPGQDLLFADFLEEIVRLADTYNEVYPKIQIKTLTDNTLEAELYGVEVDGFDEDIKAITYNDLFVKKEKGRWVGQVVIDV